MSVTPQRLHVQRLETGDARRCSVGESPVWRPAENALYWVDIPAQTIIRYSLANARRTEWTLPERVGCIAFDRNGVVLAAMESGLFAVTLAEPADGTLQGASTVRLVAAVEHAATRMRFNDGRCDRQGRFWSGTMVQDPVGREAAGKLYRYDVAAGLSGPVVEGLCTQNGLAWSPDGRTMYLSDSYSTERFVWAFDYDIDDGMPTNRRLFANLRDYSGRPDGAAVDADGCYWICANDAGRLLRFAPDGRLDRSIELPVPKPSMCAFGGPRLDMLFVTSIQPADGVGEHDGCVLALKPGVTGLAEPEFAGVL